MNCTVNKRRHECRRCGLWNEDGRQRCRRCMTQITATPWRMDKVRIQALHVLALKQKGLDYETYKLNLGAVGVATCKALNQSQYSELIERFRRLPDVQRR